MATDHKLKRLALIGPVLPYRGGIAQHTTMLHRALPDLCKHLTISFARQYPALIFPGRAIATQPTKDTGNPGLCI